MPVSNEKLDELLFECPNMNEMRGPAVNNQLMAEEVLGTADSLRLGNLKASSWWIQWGREQFGVRYAGPPTIATVEELSIPFAPQ